MLKEILKIKEIMSDEWVSQGDVVKRRILRFYVAVLATSGVRPGVEANSIRESQITQEGQRIFLHIAEHQGKYRKARTAVFSTGSFEMKSVIQEYFQWRKSSWEFDGNQMHYSVFADPRTSKVPDMWHLFRRFLSEHELLVDPTTGRNRVPYSLRHFAITQAILAENDMQTMCKIFGTSAKMIDQNYSHVTGIETARMARGMKAPSNPIGF